VPDRVGGSRSFKDAVRRVPTPAKACQLGPGLATTASFHHGQTSLQKVAARRQSPVSMGHNYEFRNTD
jgi:hypothetical protein